MKIWITRHSTGSLHAGGLERCEVWFTKPMYHFIVTDPSIVEELPFGGGVRQGLGRYGWRTENGLPPLSFGKLFGYGDGEAIVKGLPEYVWDKLLEHYGNTEFPLGWYKYEEEGNCRQEEFILEIDLNITFEIK